jgi:hypothetical protein
MEKHKKTILLLSGLFVICCIPQLFMYLRSYSKEEELVWLIIIQGFLSGYLLEKQFGSYCKGVLTLYQIITQLKEDDKKVAWADYQSNKTFGILFITFLSYVSLVSLLWFPCWQSVCPSWKITMGIFLLSTITIFCFLIVQKKDDNESNK